MPELPLSGSHCFVECDRPEARRGWGYPPPLRAACICPGGLPSCAPGGCPPPLGAAVPPHRAALLSPGAALLSPSLPGRRDSRTLRGFFPSPLGSRLTPSVLALTPSLLFSLRSVKQRCLNEQKRRRQRATKKISIFIGSFVICFGPYIITRSVSPVGVGDFAGPGCPVMRKCPGVLQLILGCQNQTDPRGRF